MRELSCSAAVHRAGPGHAHTPRQTGVDELQANRALDKRYRTTLLRRVHAHEGGFYHDGCFADLSAREVTAAEKAELIDYLKSL